MSDAIQIHKESEVLSSSSSSSLGNYGKTKLPRMTDQQRVSVELPPKVGGASSDSEAETPTPFGGRKKKLLTNAADFQRCQQNANDHFKRVDGTQIRDFQVIEDEEERAGGEKGDRQSRLKAETPCPKLSVNLQKKNSNPFKVVTQESSNYGGSPEQKSQKQATSNSFIRQPPMRAVHSLQVSAQLQRAFSKQDFAGKPEMLAIIKSTIDENNSTEEQQSQFRGAYRIAEMLGGDAKEQSQVDATLQRVTSCTFQPPDSPSDTIKSAKHKENLRNQLEQESKPTLQKYTDLDGVQLQIEGPHHLQDKSYSLVNTCLSIKRLEQGVPFDPYFLLSEHPNGFADGSLSQRSLAEFEARLKERNPKVEMSLLNRLNCHKEKFDELYKNFNATFQEKNRYPDMLPFRFNRVKLNKQFRPFQSLRSVTTETTAASQSNRSLIPFEPQPIDQLPVFQAQVASRPASQCIPSSQNNFESTMFNALSDETHEDYINASWVDSALRKQLLIAAMAPKKNNVCDFLHMIMEHNVKLVMKVCQDKYSNSEQCFRYTGKEYHSFCKKQNSPTKDVSSPQSVGNESSSPANGPNAEPDSAKNNSDNGVVSVGIFEETKGDENIKYVVEVLSEKQKLKKALTLRKVRIRKCIYRKQAFFPPPSSGTSTSKGTSRVMEDATTTGAKDNLLSIAREESKAKMSSSTSKADRERDLVMVCEDVHFFTQVQDNVWEDHKAPTSRGDQQLNYLRMAYMTRKMLKQAKKLGTKSEDSSLFIPDERILVHCSAGRGRTGTLIAAYLIAEHLLNVSETLFPGENIRETGFSEPRQEPDEFYSLYKDSRKGDESSGPSEMVPSIYGWARISLFAIVRRMREQRWCMVANDLQYQYCYQFLTQWIKNGETARLRAQLDKLYSGPRQLLL